MRKSITGTVRHDPPLLTRPQHCLPEGRCIRWVLLCIGRRIGPAPIISVLRGCNHACGSRGETERRVSRDVPAQLLWVLSEQASGPQNGASMSVARASTAADALCGTLAAQQKQHVGKGKPSGFTSQAGLPSTKHVVGGPTFWVR